MQLVCDAFDPVGLGHRGCLVRKMHRILSLAVYQVVLDPLLNPGRGVVCPDVNSRSTYQLSALAPSACRACGGGLIHAEHNLKSLSTTRTFKFVNRH